MTSGFEESCFTGTMTIVDINDNTRKKLMGTRRRSAIDAYRKFIYEIFKDRRSKDGFEQFINAKENRGDNQKRSDGDRHEQSGT